MHGNDDIGDDMTSRREYGNTPLAEFEMHCVVE